MRNVILAAALLLPALAGASIQPPRSCPVELRPGRSLGPITLGASLHELKRSGQRVSRKSAEHPYQSGPYTFRLSQGKVSEVSAELGDLSECLVYRGQRLGRGMEAQDLYSVLPGCGAVELGVSELRSRAYGVSELRSRAYYDEEANRFTCTGLQVEWGGQRKTPVIRVVATH